MSTNYRRTDLRRDFTCLVVILLILTRLLRAKQLITRPLLSAHAHMYSAVQRTRHVRAITSSDRSLEDDLTWSFKNSRWWNSSSKECLSVLIELLRNRTMSRRTEMTLFQGIRLILYKGKERSNSEKRFGTKSEPEDWSWLWLCTGVCGSWDVCQLKAASRL